jgi:hypothetical protein
MTAVAAAETTTIRISARTHQLLRSIASSEDKSLQEVVDDAAEALRRQVFFTQLQRACANQSAQERAEERAQAEVWDATLMDGLKDE